jgi:hypothetical protein
MLVSDDAVLALAKHLRDRTYGRSAVGADHPLYGQRWDALDEHARRFYLREARAQLERAAALLGFAGISSQILARYREAAVNVRDRRAESAAARHGGETRAAARTGALYSSAVARKCALGEVLHLLGIDPDHTPGQPAQDVPAEDPRPGG